MIVVLRKAIQKVYLVELNISNLQQAAETLDWTVEKGDLGTQVWTQGLACRWFP